MGTTDSFPGGRAAGA